MKKLLLALSLLPGFASANLGEVVRAISVNEVVVRTDSGSQTLRLTHLTNASGCHARWAVQWAHSTLKPGTKVQWLRDDLGQLKLYFDHQTYAAEWGEVALSFGAARLAGAGRDQLLVEAEERARVSRAGLYAACKQEDVFDRVAGEMGVGRNLLLAIALTESGRGQAPWPWTLNVEGQGYYFKSREEAHTALVGHLKRGARSIDVGAMQVNLKFHSHRFANTWDALDPYLNIRAGAAILKENFERVGNIEKAIGHYHSGTPWRANRYFDRVSRAYSVAPNVPLTKEVSP